MTQFFSPYQVKIKITDGHQTLPVQKHHMSG